MTIIPAAMRYYLPFVLVSAFPALAADVRAFGAAGDGRADDTAAIQAAIDASQPGAPVVFNGGVYRITSTLRLKGSRDYLGLNSPVLLGACGTGPQAYPLATGAGASDISVTGIVFDCGGIAFAQADWTRNISINGNLFLNITSRGSNDETAAAGVFLDHVSDVKVTNNVFGNIIDGGGPFVFSDDGPLANGIRFYHARNLTITNNAMDFVGQGISMSQVSENDPCDCANIVISNNRFTRVFRMAIEVQGGSPGFPLSGFVIEGNTATNWLNPYADTMGISFAPHSAVNAVIRNNYLDASPAVADPSDFRHYGFCLEIDGAGTLVEGNTCISSGGAKGWGWEVTGPWNFAVAIAGANVMVRHNTICDGPGSVDYESPHPKSTGSQAQIYDNNFPPCGPLVPATPANRRIRSESSAEQW